LRKNRGFRPFSRVITNVTRPPDETAIIRTYRDTIRPLYRYVSRRVGGDYGLAEDLVQETWMRALGTWPSRGVPDEPLAWLTRVARNVLVSHFRKARPEPVDPALLDLENPAFEPDAPDAAAAIGWGMARLGRRHAEILERFYYDGKSVREIAGERALSERAVEGRLRRAREKLKQKIEPIVARRTNDVPQTRTP
jgi:RNA polymerase sigma-70 factor, ECF subfamily